MSDNTRVLLITPNIWRKEMIQKGKERGGKEKVSSKLEKILDVIFWTNTPFSWPRR